MNLVTEYKPLNGVGQGADVPVRSGEGKGFEAETSKEMQRAEGRGEEARAKRDPEVGEKVAWEVMDHLHLSSSIMFCHPLLALNSLFLNDIF